MADFGYEYFGDLRHLVLFNKNGSLSNTSSNCKSMAKSRLKMGRSSFQKMGEKLSNSEQLPALFIPQVPLSFYYFITNLPSSLNESRPSEKVIILSDNLFPKGPNQGLTSIFLSDPVPTYSL